MAIYYRNVITTIPKSYSVPTEKLTFVLGSLYQKSPEYIMDVYKVTSMVSESAAKKAGAEVIRQTGNAPLSGLLYPILQVLDEEYLGCHVQFGGVDQWNLFTRQNCSRSSDTA